LYSQPSADVLLSRISTACHAKHFCLGGKISPDMQFSDYEIRLSQTREKYGQLYGPTAINNLGSKIAITVCAKHGRQFPVG
jgi:hypothetical protein